MAQSDSSFDSYKEVTRIIIDADGMNYVQTNESVERGGSDMSSLSSVSSIGTFSNSSQSETDIDWREEPSENCVVRGRGRKINNMEGNRRFVILTRGLRPRYRLAITWQEKFDISVELVNAVTRSGGRFLDFHEVMGRYVTVSATEARIIASAALRGR
jgi:hypothetical protein